MAQLPPPSTLESFGTDLVKAIESLKSKREAILSDIQDQRELKAQLEAQWRDLSLQIDQLGASLERDVARKSEYDRLIQETEGAYLKILESSETLLQVLQKESLALQQQ